MTIAESWAGVAAWRKAKRTELINARLALSPELHRLHSRRILELLIENLRERASGIVAVYYPFRREINPIPFARQVLAWGGALALPVVIGKGQPLEFRAWKPGDAMEKGPLGIPFPARAVRVEPQTLLIPVVGFDAACYRLGHGAGYYDYTLTAASPRPMAIGVGFELSRLDSIFPQPHDIPMDVIVTEQGLQRRS